ncbi:MAG: hypothetical protein H3C49_04160 [Alphaproteobacteria bacterium]|nr:hypothetical protein [Alphaproteobacteria bacterium]
MQERLEKINDYTLSQTLHASSESLSGYSHSLTIQSRITRIFNFLSAQVTTVTRDLTYEPRGSESGGSSSVSTQTSVQNFSDVQSDAEIRLMHAKLKNDLKGNPPPIEDILDTQANVAGKPKLQPKRP